MAEITTPLSSEQLVGLVRHIAAYFHEEYPGRRIDCIHLPTTWVIPTSDTRRILAELGLSVFGQGGDRVNAVVCFDDIKSFLSIPVPDMIWQGIYDVLDE